VLSKIAVGKRSGYQSKIWYIFKLLLFTLIKLISLQGNMTSMRRYNGYKAFLYNLSVEACRFLKNPKSNLTAAYIHSFFKSNSNMNVSCPFELSPSTIPV